MTYGNMPELHELHKNPGRSMMKTPPTQEVVEQNDKQAPTENIVDLSDKKSPNEQHDDDVPTQKVVEQDDKKTPTDTVVDLSDEESPNEQRDDNAPTQKVVEQSDKLLSTDKVVQVDGKASSESVVERKALTYGVIGTRNAATVDVVGPSPEATTTLSANRSCQQMLPRRRRGQRKVRPTRPVKLMIPFHKPDGIIDTHCHIDFLFNKIHFTASFKIFRELNRRFFPVQYEGCVSVFCYPESLKRLPFWESILNEEGVYGAFGCHPHRAQDYTKQVEDILLQTVKHPKVVAFGEMGLDYSKKNSCPHAVQKTVLQRQLRLAMDRKLPLVIHCREAHDDCLKIMKKLVPRDYKIHLHCFTDEWEVVVKWTETFNNLFVGFTNVITYQSSGRIRNVVSLLPLDRIILETDAPYFVPRCKPKFLRYSHPGMIIHVAEEIARIKRLELTEVLTVCRRNTSVLYGI